MIRITGDCQTCGGTGSKVESTHTWHACGRCEGTGRVKAHVDGIGSCFITCPSCFGSGGIGSGSIGLRRCPDCHGTGFAPRVKKDAN